MKIFFLYPHQDDETGTFKLIENYIKKKIEVHCIFVTTGLVSNPKYNHRNTESFNVLRKLKVKKKNIIFAGSILDIKVNQLYSNLEKFNNYLKNRINKKCDLLYIPAWEGGNPDHDALHAIIVTMGKKFNFLDRIYQYPLYNNKGCKLNFFKVLSPISENGKIIKIKINLRERIRYIFLFLQYPSQFLSWIGLFPFFFIKTLFYGEQQIQPVSFNRIYQKPHHGKLYYEVRRWTKWKQMKYKIRNFTKNNL
jgi:hypothetical protein